MIKKDLRVIRGDKTLKIFKKEAWKLIQNGNYNNTSINDFCAGCGLTKGAFYHHFQTKEELYTMVYSSYMNDYVTAEIARVEKEYPDAFDRQIEGWIAASLEFPTLFDKKITQQNLRAAQKKFWLTAVDEWVNKELEILKKGQQTDILRRDLTATQLWEMINAFTIGLTTLWAVDRADIHVPKDFLQTFVKGLLRDRS